MQIVENRRPAGFVSYRHLRRAATLCLALTFAMVLLAFLLGGCGARVKHVTNLPPGVTEQQVKNWDSAVGALHRIAATTSTLRQTVIALNKATYVEPGKTEAEKVIPDGKTYIALLSGIGRVDQAQINAANFLKTVPNAWTLSTQEKVRSYMKTIGDELAKMSAEGLTGIKNPSSRQQVEQLVAEIQAAAGLVLSLTTAQ